MSKAKKTTTKKATPKKPSGPELYKRNQYGLFERAIQQYEGKIPPQQISCVDKERLKSVLGNKPLVGSETGVWV